MFRFFENLVDPYTPYQETDTPPQRLWPFLRDLSRPFHKVFYVVAIVSFIVAAIELWLIAYMGRIVDIMTATGPSDFWAQHRGELILVVVFILLIRPVVQAVDVALLNNTIVTNFGTLVRWRSHRQVLRQSVGWFENDFAGRIANRIMQTPMASSEVVFQMFDAITYSIAYLVGATLLLGASDPRLVVPMLIWSGLYFVLLIWVVRRIGPAAKASSDARSKVTGRIVDSYTNIHAVKMFAHHDREILYAKEAIEQTRQTLKNEMRLYTIMDVGLVILNGVLIVGVVGWALALWMQGSASIGVVAAATALTLRLNAMTGWIMWAVTSFFQNLGIISEGMETIAQPIMLVDDVNAAPLGACDGKIELVNLTHHYGKSSGGLENISLTINAGEKVGLVGRSGAGKSTLVKLLLRFYDLESGSIRIDDQDISLLTQDSLRRAIGMVQQDSSLLHRSIRDNILYGRPDATEGEMQQAAMRAEAHEFVQTLSDNEGNDGYGALVGERGVKLSGGQRQRISLARVILKDAPILVLDEATSALDSEVEAAIQTTLYGMMKGKTVIAIAHRLSTIAQMDRIVVMDDGEIAEQGTHDELLASGGLYAGFWARQSGGFINADEEQHEIN